jgi:hypothetical protein
MCIGEMLTKAAPMEDVIALVPELASGATPSSRTW